MNTANVPIIVGGCHRSGTSLVRRVLNAHSRIYCGPEVKFFRDFYSDYFYDPLVNDRFMPSARSVLSEADLFALFGRAFIALHEQAAARAHKVRWADKNPENAVYLAAWERLLGEDWLYIHVVRNPLDTLASIKESRFDYAIPLDLDARIGFYQRYVHAGLDFEMAHPDRCRLVIYEELVSQPEGVLKGLMNWLKEPFERVQLEFNRVKHQSGLEDPKILATTEIHQESVGRWAKWLTPSEADKIVTACTPLWRKMDPESRWMPPPDAVSNKTTAVEEMPHAAAMSDDSLGMTMGELSQTSVRLAEEMFKIEEQRAAIELWAKELLKQIAVRDRELARIKGFWPIRAGLAVRRTLFNFGPFPRRDGSGGQHGRG